VTLAMLMAQYVLVGYLMAIRYFSPVMVLVLGAAPALKLAFRAYRYPRPDKPPRELPAGVWPLWFVAFAFVHTRRFGLLYVVALFVDVVLRKMGVVHG
jgi:1,4-dihydroxy-2-naphthoate octaprenyltransferase